MIVLKELSFLYQEKKPKKQKIMLLLNIFEITNTNPDKEEQEETNYITAAAKMSHCQHPHRPDIALPFTYSCHLEPLLSRCLCIPPSTSP